MLSLSLLGSIKDHLLPDLYSPHRCGHSKSNANIHLEVELKKLWNRDTLVFLFYLLLFITKENWVGTPNCITIVPDGICYQCRLLSSGISMTRKVWGCHGNLHSSWWCLGFQFALKGRPSNVPFHMITLISNITYGRNFP